MVSKLKVFLLTVYLGMASGLNTNDDGGKILDRSLIGLRLIIMPP